MEVKFDDNMIQEGEGRLIFSGLMFLLSDPHSKLCKFLGAQGILD